MLSTLNTHQQVALTTLFALEAKGPDKIRTLLKEKSFGKVYNALSSFKDLPFSETDFVDVGMLSPGLKNAHFFLIAMEAKGDPEVIESLKKALSTHCWGKVADKINQKLTDSSRQFSGSDLHYAHNPSDQMPCLPLPEGLSAVLEPLIGAGMAVGGFFSGTLPDFFENDFVDFFADDVAGFFTKDVAGFFTDIGEGFLKGTGDIGKFFTDDVGGIFGDVGDFFKGGFDDVGDFFGGLF